MARIHDLVHLLELLLLVRLVVVDFDSVTEHVEHLKVFIILILISVLILSIFIFFCTLVVIDSEALLDID